jgi:parallel beta-helix repeat protein
MKKWFKLLLVPLAIFLIFSSLTSVYRIVPAAKATYVLGPVTQDTYWTLVDSPFIIADNITVNPGATLTIEPGVQVRFGQNFMIIVNGGVTADGTVDKPIMFTSNNPNASAGDWGTILINGTEQSSIANCIIEYGTNGTTLESGSLNLQNNDIMSNVNGAVVDNGNATIENNMIVNDVVCGVNIAGGSQVTVENNTISSNGDGVLLTGTLDGIVSVAQNNIMLNNNSGISLDGNAYSDTAIQQNNVSSNNYGFLVTSDNTDNTYITHNYVSNNNIDGIYYGNGTGHEVHFNDIYNNTVGMYVYTPNGVTDSTDPPYIVNATYNYWGDSSGPSNAYLNPYGKGNSVGGDGVDLRFIFFLSKPSDYNDTPPTAVLQTDKTTVAPNDNVTFIGTNSFADGRVDQYFYNFGDGANSGWTTLSLFNHTYTTIGTYIASLTVMDDFGNLSQNPASVTLTVQDMPPLNVSMTLSNLVADDNGNVSVTIYVSDQSGAAIQNAAVTLLALKGGNFSPASGISDSTGQFETTFTAPKVTDTTYVRLIATATQAGFVDGSAYTYVKVLSLLHIHITTEPATVKSEETVAVIFNVTGGLGQPIANALLTTASDNGTLTANTGMTASDGSVAFNFTAPYTLTPAVVTFTTSAQEFGFTAGYDQEAVTVLPNILAVELAPQLNTIVSEGNTSVTALVTCDTIPVPNANVTVSSGNEGNFTSTTGITDSNGLANFLFTASQTTTPLNATIAGTASKSHYINGTGQTTISIVPKVLIVELTAQNYTAISEANVSMTVQVTYNLAPVQDANVTLTSNNGGNFSQPTGTTDTKGFATFFFTAPQTNEPIGITLTAHCSKTGYADGQDSLMLTINPGNVSVKVTASSYATIPDSSIIVTVSAAADSRPVAGAHVIISTNFGNFSSTTGLTDVNGTCQFVFNAPPTSVQLPVTITANVTKNGYIGNGSQTTINVVPVTVAHTEGGGFPVLTMLFILIPVIIAVIVVVLIKLKVIVVSTGEENGPE